MNKQELIDYCNALKENKSRIINCIDVDRIIDTIKQLDEPKRVLVKPFVADWIKHCRGLGYSLYQSMELVNENAEIKKWFIFVDNQDLFARAWLDGYEVEEEKRYLVKMKNMSEENTYLTFRFGHTWMLSNFEECEEFRLHHTRKQLEDADFGWVFDCPGIEIEEVE